MKKVLALVLVAVMALGMGITAFAAVEYDDREMVDAYSLGYSIKDSTFPKPYSYTHGTKGTTYEWSDDVRPSDEVELEVYLTHNMFVLPNGYKGDLPPTNKELALAAADIRKSKIAVRTQVSGGSKVLKDVKIDAKKGAVIVEFQTEWVSVKEQDFEILVYLTIDGKRMDDWGMTLIGTFANEVIPVYEEYDYVDLSVGYVAEAEDFVDKIEVDLGKGVSIFTKFFKGKSYYGTASRDADEAADVVMKKYPDIDNVVILKTVGLNSTGDIVKLDTDYSDYFVYDKDMNYVGQANEMLPYSSVYYLANKKLDIEGEEEPDEEDDEPDDEDGTNPGTGGDGASSNANANPGTGR